MFLGNQNMFFSDWLNHRNFPKRQSGKEYTILIRNIIHTPELFCVYKKRINKFVLKYNAENDMFCTQ